VEEGNGLSPFAVSIETPAELAGLVRGFFRPHKKDTRGLTTSKNIPSKNREEDEGSDDESVEAEEQCHAQSVIVTDDDDVPLSAHVIATHVREIDLAAKKASEEEEDSDMDADFISGETDDVNGAELEEVDPPQDNVFFNSGSSSAAYEQFKQLLMCEKLEDMALGALKVIECAQLGKVGKGSISPEGKHKSRNQRWFTAKAKDTSLKDNGDDAEVEGGDAVWIKRDSLVQMGCKHGEVTTVLEYKVLAFFFKYYNKWYMSLDNQFLLTTDPSKRKNVRVMARMMKATGSSYEKVELEKDGAWGPRHVYCCKPLKDVLSLVCDLVGSEV